ncbi:MAG TPA: beta-galactosidase GalA [Polyangiaceae bacterium]|nr:beta-galactosidase GalA [Polyangiaceae bacterium]
MTKTTSSQVRERISLDAGWRFAFGHPHDTGKDFGHATSYFSYLAKAGYADGPAAKDFDDRDFRELDLPHDWAVELPFDKRAGHSHGYRALGRNFPDTSVGWYRRKFFVPETDLGRRISVEFEGVFRDSQVFVNGFFLGREPSGYSGFHYDISDVLNYGGDNLLAVRVDATFEEGWFYEGAGIYRHVFLSKTAPLHVVPDGIFVSSTLLNGSADIQARATIENQSASTAAFEVDFTILDPERRPLDTQTLNGRRLAPGESAEFASTLALKKPRLWSLETPILHRLLTTLRIGGDIVDRIETPFGIRSLRFDPDHGFFLNGEHVLLKGTNNHQDHAGVGTALPDALQDFRIRTLKAMGSNAYRCSHHPPTPALLDACDRLGMLVIDETRLMGPGPSQLDELERMIRRDRNHPSVVLWSLGNEEWAMEGTITGARIAATMQAAAQRLDPTRRTTVAISGGWGKGISTVVDVMGYNYIQHGSTDAQHAQFPNQPGVGTEETTTQSTRGVYVTDAARGHSAPVANGTSGGNAETGWKYYAERPYLAGLFYWTGFDYRGESNPFGFPAVSSQFGILDSCGFPKDGYYYLKAWWGAEPVLHVFPHWSWPGREGQPLEVQAFSNADEVELWLNGASLGRKAVEKNGHLTWQLDYQPGELLARSYVRGREVQSTRQQTTTQAQALRLSVDRNELFADGSDIAAVRVSVVDSEGREVPTANSTITFQLSGPGRILGVGNGDPSSHEPDRYFSTPRVVEIERFREQTMTGGGEPPGIALHFDDSRWPAAFTAAKAEEPTGGNRIFRAHFQSPEWPTDARVRLLLRHFGSEQTVYLNGKALASFTQQESGPLPEVELSRTLLLPGQNVLAVVAAGYRDQRARERAERVRPARLRIDPPAPLYRRALFNGLAQVIVQGSVEPGELALTASSPGLAAATLHVSVKAGRNPSL